MGCGSSASASVYTPADVESLKQSCARFSGSCPAGKLQVGGAVKLTAHCKVFNTAPLLDHGWLQGRMSPDEWRAFVSGLNDAVCDSLSGQPKAHTSMGGQDWTRLGDALEACVHRQAPPAWQQQRGLRMQLKRPALLSEACLMVLPVQRQQDSAAPPAYAEVASSSPPVADATGTFAAVVKPVAASATADADEFRVPAAAFRFCPMCAAPVEPSVASKRFCGSCGGHWR